MHTFARGYNSRDINDVVLKVEGLPIADARNRLHVPNLSHGQIYNSKKGHWVAPMQVNDVVLEVEGVPIADDGTIEFRNEERVEFTHIVRTKHIGARVSYNRLTPSSKPDKLHHSVLFCCMSPSIMCTMCMQCPLWLPNLTPTWPASPPADLDTQSATQVKFQPSGSTLASAGDSLRLLILRDGEETTISYEVRIAPEPPPPHTVTTSQPPWLTPTCLCMLASPGGS